MLEMLQISNSEGRRKTIANIWNCLHIRGTDLYALGLPQKVGVNSGSLTYTAFTKTDINVKDVALACGSTIKLDNRNVLYGSGDNNSGCLGIGDSKSRLTQWVVIPQGTLDGSVVKLANSGSTLSNFGIITDKNSLYMAGRRNAMGIGDSTEAFTAGWVKSRSGVRTFCSNDSKFTILIQTDGYAYATGIGNSGSQGMFGNGRTSGINASHEGTPDVTTPSAMNFVDVECVSGTSMGITASGDMYICGMGWKVINGEVTYTNATTDVLPIFTKIASGVVNFAFGGTGGGGTWNGVCLAWRDVAGVTRYIGTNFNGVAGSGSTQSEIAFYANPVIVPYTLMGNSTFSWDGAYNSSPYRYAFYDTVAGMGFAGSMGGASGLSNLTGNLLILPIPE